MLRFFEKNAFGGCKSQIFVIRNQIAGREHKHSMRLGDETRSWLGGHSANQEATKVSLRGS